ncbi:hypothetical protein GQ651_00775 [Alphaproteobacteria bacterium GH1-50]|uniref:Uncharacterized protein n=1 Tax=Kangsaoukella pontilimi TaxID=2691042 RepID=A0A7C9IE64_9RHOB|nr:hypothetical protein [Kangsaoukella pontilimi]MXQ06369.1 hypothetical protein [Kangsaoukella pontilimi]
MNRILKSGELDGDLPDPRTDASWQARLEEARARRAVALAEKARNGGASKTRRLKPWEEEGVVIVDEDDRPDDMALAAPDFHDRVNAIQAHADAEPPSLPRATLGEVPASDVETCPLPAAEDDLPPATRAPAGTVNAIFDDPSFAEPPVGPVHSAKDAQVAAPLPVSLLLQPEPPEPSPTSPPAWRQAILDQADAPARPVIPVPAAGASAATPKRRKPGTAVYAALFFAAAIAVGPLWQMTRPVERGPLVYTLSGFSIEPALGLTAPMFEMPRETRAGEWLPDAPTPPDGPLAVLRPVVPAKVAPIQGFESFPDPAPGAPQILLGEALSPIPVLLPAPAAIAPAPFELRLGAEGVVDSAVAGGEAALSPQPRPAALSAPS